jgi:hypothetical protein
VATAPRFQIVTEFSAFEGWRNCLAVDRRESPMRPVVLSFVPARVADAPERLARLAEDVERAARLFHPNILKVIGMETFGEAPVVVQEWRDGESLRELLDTGTRMPPEVAGRIVADAAEAVHHSHGRAIAEGRPFAHGALRAERVLVGADGRVVVSGFGRAAEGDGPAPSAAEDVRALAALLLQCLAGEQPSAAGLPGVPDRLAEVAARAAESAEAFEDAGKFRVALEAAVPLAAPEQVRAWADGVLPPDAGTRSRRRRSLDSALAAAAEPKPTPAPAPAPAPKPALALAPTRKPAPVTEEVSEDSIVAALTPVPGAVAAVAMRRAEATHDADDLIVGEATGPMPVPRREESTPVSDDLILGDATDPAVARRQGENTPEIAFPRPPPPPSVAWGVVGAVASVALLAGFAAGLFLGR